MSSQVNKVYIDAQGLLEDSFRLAAKIVESGFRPSFMIAIWRGGVPMGIAVQEFLAFHGIQTDHISIRTASYTGIDNQAREIKVFGLSYLIKNMTHQDRLLIVDDVFDTGRSVEAVINHIKARARRNTPGDIRVAVPYYKPTRNQIEHPPDYYLHETEDWLKYPHSLEGLSHDEIKTHRPEIYEIIKDHL
jgi:hypoxanthine phosphoribosyltransferase